MVGVVVDILRRLYNAFVLTVVTIARREGGSRVLILHRVRLSGWCSICRRRRVVVVVVVVIARVVIGAWLASHPTSAIHWLQSRAATATGVDASDVELARVININIQ